MAIGTTLETLVASVKEAHVALVGAALFPLRTVGARRTVNTPLGVVIPQVALVTRNWARHAVSPGHTIGVGRLRAAIQLCKAFIMSVRACPRVGGTIESIFPEAMSWQRWPICSRNNTILKV